MFALPSGTRVWLAAGVTDLLASHLAEIEHLKLLIAKLKRMQFGRSSERLDREIGQFELRLEELQSAQGQLAAAANYRNPDSPRGPIHIDPATRDIVQNIYIRETRKIGDRLYNVEIETIPQVKDPWKELNKK